MCEMCVYFPLTEEKGSATEKLCDLTAREQLLNKKKHRVKRSCEKGVVIGNGFLLFGCARGLVA